MSDYDLVTVGGGLGGAALAKAMAERGARVLVVERERQFRDRVRGEVVNPWGVPELRALGLLDPLLATCGHPLPWLDTFLGSMQVGRRELQADTLHHTPFVAYYHPAMQEVLLQAAADAGAEVRRGARVVGVRPGPAPAATVEQDGRTTEVTARLLVGVDGRSSSARAWGRFEVAQDPDFLCITGLLLDDMPGPDDTATVGFNPALGEVSLLFPQGKGRARAYRVRQQAARRTEPGEPDGATVIAAIVAAGAPAELYESTRVAGPIATFSGADHWVPHPYRDGVVLIGDAAAASDPAWGQGMSLTLRDVRVLRDRLLATDDWDAACHAYATDHDAYYGRLRRVAGWLAEFFLRTGVEGDALRDRALPLIAADQTRLPDFVGSGPDLDADEAMRRRFFAED